MFINKNKKGYGYYTTVKSKSKTGEELTGFMPVNFKIGEEPGEDSIKGELCFIEEDGSKRKAFFNAFRRGDGTVSVGLFLMGKEVKELGKNEIRIEELRPDDLPFY